MVSSRLLSTLSAVLLLLLLCWVCQADPSGVRGASTRSLQASTGDCCFWWNADNPANPHVCINNGESANADVMKKVANYNVGEVVLANRCSADLWQLDNFTGAHLHMDQSGPTGLADTWDATTSAKCTCAPLAGLQELCTTDSDCAQTTYTTSPAQDFGNQVVCGCNHGAGCAHSLCCVPPDGPHGYNYCTTDDDCCGTYHCAKGSLATVCVEFL